MDDKNLNEKIQQLKAQIEEQNKHFRAGAARSAIVYAILVIFVLVYTTVLYSKISAAVTPSSVAALMTQTAREKLPELRAELTKQMPPLAGTIAEKGINAAESIIPNAGMYARTTVDVQVDSILDEFESKNLPIVEQIVDETVTTVLASKDLKGKSLGKAISEQASARVEEELDKLLNANFYTSIANLKKDLDNIRTKKEKDLTRKEASERSFLICWLRLTEIAKTSDQPGFLTSISAIADQASLHLKDVKEIIKEGAAANAEVNAK